MANRSRFAGWYAAADYAYGCVGGGLPPALKVDIGTSATGVGTLQLVTGMTALSDGTVLFPLAINAPINVGSALNAEQVTPTAVGNPTSTVYDAATVTATFTNLHGEGDIISSASFGLQEAINAANGAGGGIVVVDAGWFTIGGTVAILAAAVLPANGSVTIQNNAAGGGGIQSTRVVLTNAQTKAQFSAPTSVLPAPGAGLMYQIVSATYDNVVLTAAFANGGVMQLSYGTGTTIPATATIPAAFLTGPTASQVISVAGVLGSNLVSAIANVAIFAACATADFITGAGHLEITIYYKVIAAK